MLVFVLRADAQPPNDDFSRAVALEGADGWVDGSTIGATWERGEASVTPAKGGASVWYLWRPEVQGTAVVQITERWDEAQRMENFLPVVTAFQADSAGRLAMTAHFGHQLGVLPSFQVIPGRDYWLAVDGADAGAQGLFSMSYGVSEALENPGTDSAWGQVGGLGPEGGDPFGDGAGDAFDWAPGVDPAEEGSLELEPLKEPGFWFVVAFLLLGVGGAVTAVVWSSRWRRRGLRRESARLATGLPRPALDYLALQTRSLPTKAPGAELASPVSYPVLLVPVVIVAALLVRDYVWSHWLVWGLAVVLLVVPLAVVLWRGSKHKAWLWRTEEGLEGTLETRGGVVPSSVRVELGRRRTNVLEGGDRNPSPCLVPMRTDFKRGRVGFSVRFDEIGAPDIALPGEMDNWSLVFTGLEPGSGAPVEFPFTGEAHPDLPRWIWDKSGT